MKIFGTHEPSTLAQLADVASRAEQAALMADGHVGYVMPIGGVAAYREQVSVVGVGFDIACLATGSEVQTRDGYWLPIERVMPTSPVVCWDGTRIRDVTAHIGAAARGVRATSAVRLGNGRTIVATADHRVMTRRGWVEVEALTPDDVIACPAFRGLPFELPPERLDLALRDGPEREQLAARGLWPLSPRDPRFPALVRLLGIVSGDGHLSHDGKSISMYTTDERDAVEIMADATRLGFAARVYRRQRKPTYKPEIHLKIGSKSLHALLAALGSPVGRTRWSADGIAWLADQPAWVRAQFVSAFASAEMMTPRFHANGTVPNLQLKQSGDETHAIAFVAGLLRSLGFDVSVAPSAQAVGRARPTWVLQLLGGEAQQVRFIEEVGFCFAAAKRERGAAVASLVWQHAREMARRVAAREESRARHAAGEKWRTIVADVAARHGVSRGFAYHAIYDRRGTPRRVPGGPREPDTTGEICWEPVASVEPAATVPVFDVVTSDPAQAFVAGGIVVHNCGNAAIQTDLTLAELGDTADEVTRTLNGLADEIAATVSFGMGRRNTADDAPVDDPLFEDAAWGAVPAAERRGLLHKARTQLGTVGSGNHYVDVFADEAGVLWVGVHFGSRGFGHTVASAFLALGQGKRWGEHAPEREVLLDLARPMGHDYWQLMRLAGRYAYAGREWVARKVVELLGAREVALVHNHHNFAWRETHGGEELIVVRKGATPAFPGQLGFVGGSMGDDAVIVRGTSAPEAPDVVRQAQRDALFSTVHGAGRVMSRTQAAGKRHRRTGQVLAPGRITPAMMRAWVGAKGVVLRGGGLDESPHVYRRLPEVLAAQEGTIEVLHTLRPLIVVMAGAEEYDPYRD